MKKYKVWFNPLGKYAYGKECDLIWGYTEEDAILGAKLNRQYIETIYQTYD